MRRILRSALMTFVAIFATIGLTVGSAFAAALAFGAVALIVPGTGTPIAGDVKDYMTQAQKRYLQGTGCADAATCTLEGVDYPASFWPLSFFPGWCRSGPDGCDKWDESVGKGTTELEAELATALETPPADPNTPDIVIFGYSQGGAVVSNVLSDYIDKLGDDQKKRIQVVTIGGIQTPDGGLWSRLGFLKYIPILDVTLTPPMKPDTGVNFTSYAFHYDPVADAPRYWGNPFAMLNALAALETVHGYYLTPNGNGPTETLPYGYTDKTLAPQLVCNVGVNCRKDTYGNQYVVIPATSLPIADLVYQLTPAALRPIVKPLIELVAPAYRVLAELGYDYSGDPSVPTPLSLLPFNPLTFNPITFAIKMVGAIVEGIKNALGGGTSLSPLNPPETATTVVNVPDQTSSDPNLLTPKLALVPVQKSIDQDTADVAALGDEKTVAGEGAGAGDQDGVDQKTLEKEAAAADKAAAKQAAADKAAAKAADREAAKEAAAEKREAAAEGRAAARKETADEAAAVKAAASAAKQAAKKAKQAAAANNGVGKHDGSDADHDAAEAGTGQPDQKAA